MEAVIIASGDLADTPHILDRISRAGMIIAADGGAAHLLRLNLLPQVIIGDMDSVPGEVLDFFEAKGVPVERHPPAKDQTDTELCIDWALARGASRITLLGASGTRLDHTLANLYILKRLADLKVRASLLDACNEIYLVTDGMTLDGAPGDLLSLVPASDKVTGICLEGLEYPLENATLTMGTSRGVSNRFSGPRASVTIGSGLLWVIRSRD